MPAFPIMLFGGKMGKETKGDDELVQKYEAVTVDDWISFGCDWKYADLMQVSLYNIRLAISTSS